MILSKEVPSFLLSLPNHYLGVLEKEEKLLKELESELPQTRDKHQTLRAILMEHSNGRFQAYENYASGPPKHPGDLIYNRT